MRHNKTAVRFFYSPCNNVAFNISAVNVIIFKSTVAAADCGLSDKSRDVDILRGYIQFNQIFGNVPSVHGINNIL